MSYAIKNLVENKILVKQKDAQKLSENRAYNQCIQ